MADDALFDLEPTAPAATSPDRRRTLRQAARLTVGQHPLAGHVGHLPLHPQAAPADDRTADGRRCGNCRFRRQRGGASDRTWPKCHHGDGVRITGGPGTDCRAWWPGCVDHEYGDPRLPDAARWVPEAAAHDLAVGR